MKIAWATAAEQDRADIMDYIAADNPLAAIQMDECFEAAAASLADHPHLGKVGQIAGTRELIPHESYRLVYEVQADIVWILAVVHTKQQQADAAALDWNAVHASAGSFAHEHSTL